MPFAGGGGELGCPGVRVVGGDVGGGLGGDEVEFVFGGGGFHAGFGVVARDGLFGGGHREDDGRWGEEGRKRGEER